MLELMAVMLIMFLLMGMATISMRGLMRGTGFTGAVNNVTGVMRQARQYAIMRGVRTQVVFDQNSMNIWRTGASPGLVAEERHLPEGIQFNGNPGPVDFNPDGTPGDSAGYTITVEELYVADAQITNIVVNGTTGWVE